MSLPEDEFLIRKILLTHDPDGRQVDSELLLRAVENVVFCATPEMASHRSESQARNPHTDVTNILNTEGIRLDEISRCTLNEIYHEILQACFSNQDLHTQAMSVFEKLEHYKWGAKVTLVLTAFGMSYGEFCLRKQSEPHNPLAALFSSVKKLPVSVALFKGLTLSINIMIEVSRIIIEFESLPLQQEVVAKDKIYIATYWIFRSAITCSSLIAGLRTIKHDQVNSSSRIIAARTFSCLVEKLNKLYSDLEEQLRVSHQQIDTKLSLKLVNLFDEVYVDNQEVLHTLFAMKDNFPFKCFLSREKYGIKELQNKVVILLISKPELLPVKKLFWLARQIYDHQETEPSKEKFAILWVPVSSSNQEDERTYEYLSNSLPFFSLRRPGLLNATVEDYIKREWNFEDEPIMVVLDINGSVTSLNAMDMVWIWGMEAFPFSVARERDLWERESSMMRLVIDGISPLMSSWVDEGKNICIYASNNLEWIRHFIFGINEMKRAGIQLEAIYVGWRNPDESIQNIIDTIEHEKLSASLSFTKIHNFWLRVESIKNSISRLKQESGKEMLQLLEINDDEKGFVIVGSQSLKDSVKLSGEKIRECFELFPTWAESVAKMGLAMAIKNVLELPFRDKMDQRSKFLPYEEGLTERILICSKCRSLMEKVVVYICNVAE